METRGTTHQRPQGKRVLSGTQPSGVLHIGNYFGAIRQYISLQQGNDAAYFIADLHSLNSVRDPKRLRELTREVALDYLALGVDPKQSILYRQSDLPEVTELCWVLSTVTPMGLLERCHSYKDKLAAGMKPDHGLFAYPVLMAADILIHRADVVPVGQDQRQHLEVTRDIAVKFNQTYGELFRLPEAYIQDEVATVPGIDGRKMSKSYDNTIQMFASQKQLKRQVMSIVTDSTPVEQPKDPASSTVYALFCLLASPAEREAEAERYRKGGTGYGEAKQQLLGRLLAYFGPARERREQLAGDPDAVEDVLADGAKRARAAAASLMEEVRSATGIGAVR